jgi:nucleoside-diphosphate-sugar epimerase
VTRVLITGSAGFIGSHLAQDLAAVGYDVAGIDLRAPDPASARIASHVVDIRDLQLLSDTLIRIQPDIVVHLAARTDLLGTTIADYEANTAGVANMARAVASSPSVKRVVMTSSQLVCRPGYAPSGDDDYAPDTPYGESKARGEQIWKEADGAGREWCIVRPTTIWGPRMNPHYLRFFRMIRSGRYFHVGSKPVMKSYGYIGNTTAQLRCLMEAPAAAIHRRTFYIADDPIELASWAEAFRRDLGAPPIRRLPLAIAAMAARVGDTVAALGWRSFPFTSFRLRNVMVEGVVDTAPLRAICGSQRSTMQDGVAQTAEWLRSVLS